MNVLSKLYYHTWNIGFVERDIKDVILSSDTVLNVHWVRHNYHDRFFADPFILSVTDDVIKVLVEDFPYYDKRGMISLLTVDRKNYQLLDRKVVLKQPFHMSYPFIFEKENGVIWIAPEASKSGCLYRYTMNAETEMLENQCVLMADPLLDSTIIKYEGKYWLFSTKRGAESNSALYVYYSETAEGPWKSHEMNPVVRSSSMARPAGNMVEIDGILYRVCQECSESYGMFINVSKVKVLKVDEYEEEFVKELHSQDSDYSESFHTINGKTGLCVVDGVKKVFSPIRRAIYEYKNWRVQKSRCQ